MNDIIFNCSDKEITNIIIQSLSNEPLIDLKDNPSYKVVKLAKCFPVLEKGYKKELTQISEELNLISNLKCIGRHGKFQWDGIDDVIQAANNE